MHSRFCSSYDVPMRIVATCVVAALFAACGDVQSVIIVTQEPDGGGSDGAADASIVPTEDAGDGGGGGSDGGTDAPPDSEIEGGADPIFGTTTFVPGAPGTNANLVVEHSASELPLQGKNCFKAGGCHAENNHKYGFAGTLYESANGGAPIKGAEIRVTDQGGTLVGKTYTDDDGNFWFEGPKPPAGARVGVRKGLSKGIMSGAVAGDTGAACNSAACHGQTSLRVYLP